MPTEAEIIEAATLARFRANPGTVRVAIRRMPDGRRWCAFVTSRTTMDATEAYDADPATAIDAALTIAAEIGMPGIDLGMGWAYRHPQKARR